jgi:hypothetical protein
VKQNQGKEGWTDEYYGHNRIGSQPNSSEPATSWLVAVVNLDNESMIGIINDSTGARPCVQLA